MDLHPNPESALRRFQSRWLLGAAWILGGIFWLLSTLALWDDSTGGPETKNHASSAAHER